MPSMCATYTYSFSVLEGEINHFQAQEHVLGCGEPLGARGQNFHFWINSMPNFNFLLLMPRI